MRSAFVVGILACAVGFAVWRLLPDPAGEPPRTSVPAWTGGRLTEVPGMTILRLAGSPREKGRAHGERLKERIRARYERLDPSPFYVDTLGPRAAAALPPELREEIEGIAEGCGLRFQEVWYLNLRFDFAAFEDPGFHEEAAVAADGRVLARFDAADLEDDPRELCVFVHLDERPLVLVGLPGMAGGFLGSGAFGVGAVRPTRNAPDPVLTGLAWPLLFRLLLEQEGEPRLPAPASLDASAVLERGAVGTLDFSPRTATWHPLDTEFAMARREPLSDAGTLDEASVRLSAQRARQLFAAPPPGNRIVVRLARGEDGVTVVVERNGVRFARMIRWTD
jgi:hypothetical protein